MPAFWGKLFLSSKGTQRTEETAILQNIFIRFLSFGFLLFLSKMKHNNSYRNRQEVLFKTDMLLRTVFYSV